MKRLTPRRLRMIKLYKDGKSMDEIGPIFNISRERVRQILRKYLPVAGYIVRKTRRHHFLQNGLPTRGSYFVYFIQLWYDTSKGRRHHIYVGQTGNLQKRWDHYLYKYKGAVPRLRQKNGTMRLAYFEQVKSRGMALAKEREYKLLSDIDKLKMINAFKSERKVAELLKNYNEFVSVY